MTGLFPSWEGVAEDMLDMSGRLPYVSTDQRGLLLSDSKRPKGDGCLETKRDVQGQETKEWACSPVKCDESEGTEKRAEAVEEQRLSTRHSW
jgi:hypothetical protein